MVLKRVNVYVNLTINCYMKSTLLRCSPYARKLFFSLVTLQWLSSSVTANDKYFSVRHEPFNLTNGIRFSPRIVITGVVTDDKGTPLQGVNIIEKGGETGVTSDNTGKYSINVRSQNSILVFSFIGYVEKEVPVGASTSINVKLELLANSLSDVVVVGYGTQKRSEVTNAVAQVSGEEIRTSNALSVSNSLAGRLPGLFVTQRGAAPGFDDAEIRVRGPRTFRNTSALIVIDGVANADPDGLSRIDPQDIETISVLKDASAAIYGAQSAGGVVLVTTKRGKPGKASFEFTPVMSFQYPTTRLRAADVFQYTKVLNDRRALEGTPPDFPEELINEFRTGARRPEDWYAALVDGPAKQNRQSLNMRGGTDKVRYFVSVGTAAQGGILRGDDKTKLRQYNIRSNVDVSATRDLEVSLDVSLREKYTTTPQSAPGGDVGLSAVTSPLQEAYIYGDYRYPGEGWSQSNPAARLLSPGYRRYKSDVASGTIRLKYNIPFVPGLSLDGFANVVKNVQYNKVFNWTWFYWERGANPGEVVKKTSRTIEDIGLREDFAQNLRITSNIRLSYDRVFRDKHKFSVFVAYEQMDYDENNFFAQRLGFDSPLIDQLFAGSADRQNWSNDGGAAESARQNYFGRLSYQYKGKYLLNFSSRYDGSPIFPEEKRFGFFPQASAAWVISKESFMPDNLFSNLKLRGSWGQLGNDRVNPFQYVGAFAYAPGFVINGQDVRGVAATSTPNPNITWEVTEISDIGLEAGLLNNRLTFEFDVYKSKTTRILAKRQASIPNYTGLVLPDENIGRMDSKGFDVALSYRKNFGKVMFTAGGNYSYATNEIVYFDEAPQAEPYQKLEGHRFGTDVNNGNGFGSQLVYKAIGIYRSQADIDRNVNYPGAMIGGLIFADLNGDGEINGNDRYMFYTGGSPSAQYGISFGLDYSNFDLSILFQGQSGAMWRLNNSFNSGANGNGLAYVAENSFSLDNTDAELPMIQPVGVAASESDFYYHKAKWLRLKSAQLGYTLPNNLVRRARLASLRLYVSADNLFIIYNNLKKYGTGDPEFLTGNGNVYPNMRTLTAGLSINF
jgi:TonB-linked SusC/RagA family outer membrane protein